MDKNSASKKAKKTFKPQSPDKLLRYAGMEGLSQRLDLAAEAHALLRGKANREIAGVREEIEDYPEARITTITILNSQGEKTMGKPVGHYINIEVPQLMDNKESLKPISKIISQKLHNLIPEAGKGCIMLIGLGNNQATPDSLGPSVINLTMATRHIKNHAPDQMPAGLRDICTMAPGVLGINGIETAEIIKGTVEHVKPRCIIAVDSLAAGNVARVGTNIQISDTGINPGSGIGNKRTPINQEVMGVPVIAIGVPTVVDTSIIIYESILGLMEIWQEQGHTQIPPVDNQIIESIADKLLSEFEGSLIVTPREIDALIEEVSRLIAASLAQAIHPGVNEENYHLFLR